MRKNKQNKGFTLLEILLVIGAIGILVAIVLVAINPNRQLEAARNAKRRSDINTIQKAIQQYSIDNNGQYPAGIETGAKAICRGGTPVGCIDLSILSPNYIASIPELDSNYYYVRRSNNNIEVRHPRDNIWNIGGTPSLDLNFASNKSLIDSVSGKNLIDFTRNSPATYVGEDGLIKTAGVNEPRFDHDPVTGESLGLLVEEGRENVIRNNTMVGASAVAPSTIPTSWGISTNNAELSQSVVGVGVESGIPYIDIKISGTVTTSRACDILMQSPFIPASNGQTWTHSVYLRQVGGSQTNISDIRMQGNVYSDTAYITTPWFQSVQVTTENLITQRRIATATLVGETITRVGPFIKVTTASSGVVDFTLRIGMPQLELGFFATSVIPTEGFTQTRNVDRAFITGTNFSDWYNSNEGTLFVRAKSFASPPRLTAVAALNLPSNFGANRVDIRYNQGGASYTGFNAAGLLLSRPSGFDLPDPRFIVGYKENIQKFATNGSLAGATVNFTPSPNITHLQIGTFDNFSYELNGFISQLTYYSTLLTDTQLINLTK